MSGTSVINEKLWRELKCLLIKKLLKTSRVALWKILYFLVEFQRLNIGLHVGQLNLLAGLEGWQAEIRAR